MLADKPVASLPTSTFSASLISPVEIPLRYNHGKQASTDFAFLTYGGTSAEWKTTGFLSSERTLGIFTGTEPIPVNISRSG